MKKINLTIGIFVALLFTNTMTWAESKYPAADFEPKVLYQDSDYKPNKSSSTSSSTSQVDPKYPAANFEPKVLYKDSNYKPSKFSSAASSVSSSAKSSTSNGDAAAETETETDYSLILVIMALAGVLFFVYKQRTETATTRTTRRRKRAAPQRSSTVAEDSGALTGVARYLKENKPELSSVSRYLENKDQMPASKVAKYVAKKVVAAKQNAAGAATGVEKYIRQRG